MKKLLRYSAYALAGFISLILILLAVVSMTFNPNDYKQQIIDLVQAKKNRTLKLDGDIKLAFWPKIGADLGKVSLSEHNNSNEFAAVDGVKVSLALLPLLRKELIVDTVYIDGARAHIVKYKDGSTNFDDLLSKDEDEPSDIAFDIEGVNITNSAADYNDEASGAKYGVEKFNLKTGPVAMALPVDVSTDFAITANQPQIAATVKLKATFIADPENKHFSAKNLDAVINGDLLGGKAVTVSASGDIDAKPEMKQLLINELKLAMNGQFSGANLNVALNVPSLSAQQDVVSSKKASVSLLQEKAGETLSANLVLADIKGSPKALESSGISGEIAAVQGKRTIDGKFSSPFSGNLESMIFDLPKLVGNLMIKDPALPKGEMQGSFNIAAHTDINQELANTQFSLNIDETKLNGDVSVASFKTPNIKFNLNADKLDLNKLLAKPSKTAASNPPAQAESKHADLTALKSLLLDGKVNIGSIIYDKHRVTGLNLGIKADGKKLALRGLNVKVDDSQIKGNFSISEFSKPLYTFDLDIDQLDVDRYVDSSKSVEKSADKKASDKPVDLSALKALNADGSLRIGKLKYGTTKATNIRIDLKADGKKLSLNPLAAKVDDSQINANIAIARFNDPIYSFNVNIDKLDADKYISKSDQPAAKNTADTPIDLSALKKLNASGEAKIGWLKLANIKTKNVTIGLKAADGIATLSPFSADLYQGSMAGSLKVDARATPSIAFKQQMKGIAIGPLLQDAINNDMLDGKGALNVDVSTSGNSVFALKKALSGSSAINLADGAIKGIDIAGTLREVKSKLNLFKGKSSVAANQAVKTDFSELSASFTIKNGVAHNEDLTMKAPILRLAKGDSRGDIDIGNETINYLAKPTVVKSLKGQGGAELDALAGFSIPIKISGSFAEPKFGMDFAAITAALAKSSLADKVGGDNAAAVKELLSGDKTEALKGLLNQKKPADSATQSAAPDEAAPSAADQAKEKAAAKLQKLLNF
jgi:AsmA protein